MLFQHTQVKVTHSSSRTDCTHHTQHAQKKRKHGAGRLSTWKCCPPKHSQASESKGKKDLSEDWIEPGRRGREREQQASKAKALQFRALGGRRRDESAL